MPTSDLRDSEGAAASASRILVVHPSGNIANNPHLAAAAERLAAAGHMVDFLSFRSGLCQVSTDPAVRHLVVDRGASEWSLTQELASLLTARYNLVIGTHDGIVAASALATAWAVPLVLFSYEILFRDDIDERMADDLAAACSNVVFAVCQDSLRAALLAEEYAIDPSRILCSPVAGRSSIAVPEEERQHLRRELGLPKDVRIALLAGTLSDRSMVEELLESVSRWPPEWTFVLHPFGGASSLPSRLARSIRACPRAVISGKPVQTHEEVRTVISGADVGLALYRYDYSGEYTGKNILFLGLSGGKISTYLKCGVPVVTNETGLMSDEVRRYGLGQVVDSPRSIDLAAFSLHGRDEWAARCRRYFDEHLSFDTSAKAFTDAIAALIAGQPVQHVVGRASAPFSMSQTRQCRALFDEARALYFSPSFALGHTLLNPIDSFSRYLRPFLRRRLLNSFAGRLLKTIRQPPDEKLEAAVRRYVPKCRGEQSAREGIAGPETRLSGRTTR